jgi:hypothetical protein
LSGFVGVVFVGFFFLARGNARVAPALALGPRGTTAVRNGEHGANTPDRRCSGKRGDGIKAGICTDFEANWVRRGSSARSTAQPGEEA